jgi:hypothetical protein
MATLAKTNGMKKSWKNRVPRGRRAYTLLAQQGEILDMHNTRCNDDQ